MVSRRRGSGYSVGKLWCVLGRKRFAPPSTKKSSMFVSVFQKDNKDLGKAQDGE